MKNVDIFTKGTITVVANMRKNLNMSCDIIQVDNYGWNANGTFHGVMGLFKQKRIQALTHGTLMSADRLEYAEFTAELFVVEYVQISCPLIAQFNSAAYLHRTPFILRQPPLSAVSNIFLLPLSMVVWRCYVIALAVVILIMLTQLKGPLHRDRLSVLDIVTFVCGAVCQQGTHLVIPTTSGRFIVLTTFLTTLAIFTSYSASIVALLQSPSHSIKTIEDLMSSPLKMALQDTSYNRQNYQFENISMLKPVYDKKIQPIGKAGWIFNLSEGVEKIRTELFACQLESPSAYKAIANTFTESEKCGLTEIHLLRLAVTTVMVERNSPYKELFKRR